MEHIRREDIHILGRHSKLPEEAVQQALEEHVYPGQREWGRFLRLFLMTLGVGFTVSGIIFFFAYNWDDLHKFVKLGLTLGLLLGTTVLALLPRIQPNIRNIILTGAAMLVGVWFAVFGQIYQTGANAYDFFLAWTIFISLWVFVSNFAPMWLIYLVLINTTFILYVEQVSRDWPELLVMITLFGLNSAFTALAVLLPKFNSKAKVPNWFVNVVGLAAACFGTMGMVFGIFEESKGLGALVPMYAAICTLAVWYALRNHKAFFISVVAFSLIIIISSLLIKASDGEGMFLLVCLFIILSVTLVVRTLISLQKKWKHGA